MFNTQSTISNSEPRLTSVRLQTSSYGRPIAIAWGRSRVSGNALWYGNFVATPHTSITESGGKGGGGGIRQENTTYTYSTGIILGLGEGPITSINQVYSTKSKSSLAALGFTAFLGTYSQNEWGFMSSAYPSQALKYRGEAYVAASALQLGNHTGVDNYSFEITGHLPYSAGTIDDANMAEVVLDFLTNPYYGIPTWSGALVSDLTAYSNYCRAFSLFMSPVLQEHSPAAEILQHWANITNTQLVSSEGKLKFVPYGDKAATANGATYTPPSTALALTDDEFLSQGNNKPPVLVTRRSGAESFNHIRIEFLDRANDYNPDIEEAKDQADIDIYGLRSGEVLECHEITTRSVAKTVVQLMLQRQLYVRNQYQFRLGWRYVYLEPGDLLTLTDSAQGIEAWPVRIVEVEEDEEGALTIVAEDYPGEVSSVAQYGTGTADGYVPDFNADPGSVDFVFPREPPLVLTNGSPQIWLAASGSDADYGGCEVWVADATETSYRYAATIQGRSRAGYLTANFPTGADPDTTNVLSVNLSTSLGTLTSSSSGDADLFRTLCYVGDELVAYSAATLTSPNNYNLDTYIRRGVYGTPKGSSSGDKFACMDQAIARFPYKVDEIGRTIKVKLLAFNQFGHAKQALADVTAVSYTIVGVAVQVVTGLAFSQPFIDAFASIKWDKNIHAVSYTVEVRRTAGDVLLRTVDTADTKYTYGLENNLADGGPFRDLTFRVRANTATNIGTVWASVSATNPVPSPPTGITLYPGAGIMNVAYTPDPSPDYKEVVICGSAASGFTPNVDTNALYRGSDSVATVPALINGTAYYFRLASADVFGIGSFSSEFTSTPVSFSQTPQELVQSINSVIGNSTDDDKLVFSSAAFAIEDPDQVGHYPFAVVDLGGGEWAAMLQADVVIGGNLSVANLSTGSLPNDVVFSLGGGIITLEGSGAISVYKDLGANQDFVLLTAGDILFKKYITGVGYVDYKSLRRLEAGVADSGTTVAIPGYWDLQPKVFVSPNTIQLYNSAYTAQSQSLRCQAEGIVETAPDSKQYQFNAVATLELASATGQTQINVSSGDTSAINYTSATYTTPANSTSITLHIQTRSKRGTGATGIWNIRRYRFRVDYKLTSSGTWTTGTLTAWTNFPSSLDTYVSAERAVSFGSTNTWNFRLYIEWDDTGSTFGTPSYTTSNENLTGTGLGQVCRSTASYPNFDSDTGSLGGLPASTLNPTWEIYQIVYTFQYDLQQDSNRANPSLFYYGNMTESISCRGTLKNSNSYTDQSATSIPQKNNVSGSHTYNGSSHVTNPITGATTCNITTGGAGGFVSATVNLDSLSAIVRRRTPVANSATAVNTAVVQFYDYNLATAEIISSGSLNWMAVGI